MSGCEQITDEAFEHLKGIHTLNMSGCEQITDEEFEHLKEEKKIYIILYCLHIDLILVTCFLFILFVLAI